MSVRASKLIVLGILVAASCLSCGPAVESSPSPAAAFVDDGPGRSVLFHERSAFQDVYVVEEDGILYLRFDSPDGDDQSRLLMADREAVPLECIRLATVALAHLDSPRTALMIGLGGGTFTNLLRRVFPEARIEAVEIDPAVVRAAQEFFDVPADDERYRVHVGDGGAFVAHNTGPYDLVFLDAYGGSDIPEHLATERFFTMVRDRLSERGVAVMNMAVPDEDEPALMEAFRAAFADPACYRAVEDDNLIVVGAKGPAPGADETAARAAVLQKRTKLPVDLVVELRKRVDCSKIGPGH